MTASTKAKPDLDAIQARARETARRLGLGEEPEEWEIAELTEQIRQAEQAAFQQGWNERDAIDLAFHPEIEKACADERRKTLEEAAQYIADKEPRGESPAIAACASLWSAEIRALAQSSEPGGAA